MEIQRILLEEIKKVTGLFDQYRVFYGQESDPERAELFLTERLKCNESIIFAAVDSDDYAIGFAQLYPKYSSVRTSKNWILNDLYVLPAFRKHGIATLLIATASNFARNKSAKFLQLETAVSNTDAQKLYESIGFEKQGVDTEYFVYKLLL